MNPISPESLAEAFAFSEEQGLGLCSGICIHFDAAQSKTIRGWMQDWPEYSGSPDYPVDGPDGVSPYAAFNRLGRWIGPYGEARRRLAAYLIERAAHATPTA